MSNDHEMHRKMLEIGARYLARTVNEIDDLKKLVGNVPAGGKSTLKDIEILAHRIRGSGAVFGFAKLSDAAGDIEMLAVNSALSEQTDSSLATQFNAHLQRLSDEVKAANGAHKN